MDIPVKKLPEVLPRADLRLPMQEQRLVDIERDAKFCVSNIDGIDEDDWPCLC